MDDSGYLCPACGRRYVSEKRGEVYLTPEVAAARVLRGDFFLEYLCMECVSSGRRSGDSKKRVRGPRWAM